MYSYVGEYKDGESNGYGKMTFPNIGVYDGYFVDGKRSGIGTFTWSVGDTYVGNWENDTMSGNGTYTFADGYVISGTWGNNCIPISSISMSLPTMTLEENSSTQIIALCKPKNSTEIISWESSDEAVITVSSKRNLCTINAIAIGSATVTATTASGKTCCCEVTVKEASKTTRQITLNHGDYSLNIGGRVALTATIVPANAIDGSIQWSSSSSSVANVNANGVVTAYSEGTTIISATSENGVVATCYITVYNPRFQLWNGNWNVFSSDSSGNKKTKSATATSIIDIANSSAYLSFYPFSGTAIPISESGNYTLLGGIGIQVAYYFIGEMPFITTILNIVIAFIVSFAFFAGKIWAAGDAKLFTVTIMLIPYQLYSAKSHEVFPAFFILGVVFSIALVYVFFESIILCVNDLRAKKTSNIVAYLPKFTKDTIIAWIMGYLAADTMDCFLLFWGNTYVATNSYLLVLLNLLLVTALISLIDTFRWRLVASIILIALRIALSIMGQIAFSKMSLWTVVIVTLIILIRAFTNQYNYRTIPTSEVQAGQILAKSSLVYMLPSTVKDLPQWTDESTRCRISANEAEAIKRWETSKYGQSEITIVRNIPFAPFIFIGTLLYIGIKIYLGAL